MCCWQASKIALKSKQSRRLRPTGAHATKLFVFLFSRRQSLIYCHCRLHAISQSLSLQPPWCAPVSYTASSQSQVLRSYLQQSLFDSINFEYTSLKDLWFIGGIRKYMCSQVKSEFMGIHGIYKPGIVGTTLRITTLWWNRWNLQSE